MRIFRIYPFFFDLTFVIVERCHDAIFMQFNLNTNLTVDFSHAFILGSPTNKVAYPIKYYS